MKLTKGNGRNAQVSVCQNDSSSGGSSAKLSLAGTDTKSNFYLFKPNHTANPNLKLRLKKTHEFLQYRPF